MTDGAQSLLIDSYIQTIFTYARCSETLIKLTLRQSLTRNVAKVTCTCLEVTPEKPPLSSPDSSTRVACSYSKPVPNFPPCGVAVYTNPI